MQPILLTIHSLYLFSPVRSDCARVFFFLFNIFAYIKNFQYLCSVFHKLMILIGVKLCLPVRRECARVSFLSIYLHISKICCTFAAVFCMNHNYLTRSQRVRAGVLFYEKSFK